MRQVLVGVRMLFWACALQRRGGPAAQPKRISWRDLNGYERERCRFPFISAGPGHSGPVPQSGSGRPLRKRSVGQPEAAPQLGVTAHQHRPVKMSRLGQQHPIGRFFRPVASRPMDSLAASQRHISPRMPSAVRRPAATPQRPRPPPHQQHRPRRAASRDSRLDFARDMDEGDVVSRPCDGMIA
jgi:hypothetical protein